jgi:opacity protein-like surface antigen
MKNSIILIIAFCGLGYYLSAQETSNRPLSGGGRFELGVRSTGSFFNNANARGMGWGGQFRLRIVKRINTEWYGDFLTADIGSIGTRKDMHIGWSVMMYPFNADKVAGKFTPYIIVGHCFDGSRVYENNVPSNEKRQFSTAMQLGLGTSYNITDNFDLTLTCQYMNHLGGRIQSRIVGDDFNKRLEIVKTGKTGIDGHLLVSLSLNVKLFDFWTH